MAREGSVLAAAELLHSIVVAGMGLDNDFASIINDASAEDVRETLAFCSGCLVSLAEQTDTDLLATLEGLIQKLRALDC